jgi:Acyl-CoA reductase (LuxC)
MSMTEMLSILRRDGGWEPVALDDLVGRLARRRQERRPAFTGERMAALSGVAESLLRDRALADTPALRLFGFAMRKGAMAALERDFRAGLPGGTQAFGRGVVFHLPPTNVDTLFLYSWAVAYLSGNVSVTRLPSTIAPPIERALRLFLDAVPEGDEDLFVTYPAREEINRALSAEADARLVWGGDEKVALFHDYPLRRGGKPLVFPDRRSFSVFDGEALAALDADGRRALAQRMSTDVFVFDQMACSSPHILYVQGDAARHGDAVDSFLADLGCAGTARATEPAAPAHGVVKLVQGCALAASGVVDRVARVSPHLTVVHLAEQPASWPPRIGGGFLYMRYIDGLGDVEPAIDDADQTVTYFGFPPETLDAFVAMVGRRGVYRVVPVGQALDFDVVWDGYDLLRELVRLVRVRG